MLGAKIEEFNFSASELSSILDELLNSNWDDERDVEISADSLQCMRAMAILCNRRISAANETLHRADEMMKELEKRVELGKTIISRLTDKDMNGDVYKKPIPLTGELAKDIYTFYSGT